ncbi:MAG: hypothetical protein ACK5UI_02560 [Bacteroidota bacterium]|jgi:hypothetical protein
MAKNLIELEKELFLLRHKKTELKKQLTNDASLIGDVLRPGNILKLGIREILPFNMSNLSLQSGGILTVLGTFIIDKWLLGKSSFIKRLLVSLVSSEVFQDLVKGEDSKLKKWALKLKSLVKKDQADQTEVNTNESDQAHQQ